MPFLPLPAVKGRCPACGLAALFLGDGGYVTCGNLQCPDPCAATDQLERTAVASAQPTPGTCDASMPGVGAAPIGPCVLRAGHDGPVHQAASGAKWWPTDAGPVPGVRPLAEIMQLDANSIDPAATHPEPPDGAAIWEAVVRLYGGPLPPWSPPPACPCGGQRFAGRILHNTPCWWKTDTTPLREVAAQALAEEQCRAEFHHPTMQSARCDLAAGHPDYHREQPDPARSAFRWDDSVALYPTTSPEDPR